MVDTKDGEMPCHVVHPHHDVSPGQDGRESQPLPGKRRCRLVTGGERPSRGAHGDDQACQRAREDCSGGPPPYWEASVSLHPPAAGHHAPQKLSASRPAPDLCRLLGRLACHTPCPFGTKTELESNSQTRHQRVCARVGFDLTITIIEGRQIVPCLQSDNGRA